MTVNDSPRQTLFPAGLSHRAGIYLRQVGEWTRRLLIAFAVILAAGLLAVVTAIFGLVLAAIALLMRFGGRGMDVGVRRRHQQTGSLTLEAHRTARGWTVE